MAFQADSIYWVEVEKVVPNPFQPRREFDEQKLRELADSVRMYGILQPLTVTRKEVEREDGTFYTEYELIAGERRLRASKLAGLSQVPVIIREGDDSEQEKLELAIIENLQREDLGAIDRALAFRQLADVFGLSHIQVARKVGRSREYVSNTIRLLGLPEHMQNSLRMGEMSEGHARTLLMLNDRPVEQDVVFREILLKKLSVREVERIVRKIATDKVRKKDPLEFDDELIEIEKQFMETLGTRVQIQKTDYGGKLTIDYFSVGDLEAMLLRMRTDSVTITDSTHDQLRTLVENTPLAYVAAPIAITALPSIIPEVSEEVILVEESFAPEVLAEVVSEVDPMPYVEEGRFEDLMNATDQTLIEAEPVLRSYNLSFSPMIRPEVFLAPVSEPVFMHNESIIEQESAEALVSIPDLVAEELPAAVVASEPEEDDSDLYAIRHFSV